MPTEPKYVNIRNLTDQDRENLEEYKELTNIASNTAALLNALSRSLSLMKENKDLLTELDALKTKHCTLSEHAANLVNAQNSLKNWFKQ